ncbi:hypothetical protein [Telluribacter sp.]|jgi:uncharacterized protein YozE (UPF0346 family)|uniref:hypothetical protein n=1 Tax=Telluribacter sp. TaxID=1978767 RepID=UPI002E14C1C0|nr:hypothetical protein [Telluribacter sp.]
MKKSLLFCVIVVLLAACKGEQGEVGPQGPAGPKGETGTAGPQGAQGTTGTQGPKGDTGTTGAQGPAGQDAAQPKVFDFTAAFAGELFTTFTFPKALDRYDFVLIYIQKDVDLYSALPFKSWAYTADGENLQNLDLSFEHNKEIVRINANKNDIPADYTFKYRIVVLKGAAGGRVNAERYRNYANLKLDYNL